MRFARSLAVAGIATAALLGTTGTASAHNADVVTGTNGTCPVGYYEYARLGSNTVCVHVGYPDVVMKTASDCPTSYVEYSVLNGQYGVCIRWSHT